MAEVIQRTLEAIQQKKREMLAIYPAPCVQLNLDEAYQELSASPFASFGQ
jgi:hypothetical protein